MRRHYLLLTGCLLLAAVPVMLAGRSTASAEEKARPGAITYTKQVARLIQQRCQSCHRPDGVAPFALMTYEQARGWSRTMREVVAQRRMPPWHADPRYGKFLNDRSLTPGEIETLVNWVDAGAPKGDERDMPAPASFPKGWTIGTPDRVVEMPQEYEVPAEGVLPYKEFTVDPGFKEDVWVERAEAKAGCKAVHHIIIYLVQGGRPKFDFLGNSTALTGTAPGDMPLILRPGQAKKIPAGARIMFEVHYTPNGKVERDRSAVALIFAKQPPKQEVMTHALPKVDIRIPPGDANHREESVFTFPENRRILSLMPHMHLRGKSWEYRILYPDGRAETILNVPRYDFNWQSIYRFADPPLLPKGARLQCIAHWDNSAANPANPDATKLITFGPQTWDEMMLGWMDYVVEPAPVTAASAAG
jgi:hypothetical protein